VDARLIGDALRSRESRHASSARQAAEERQKPRMKSCGGHTDMQNQPRAAHCACGRRALDRVLSLPVAKHGCLLRRSRNIRRRLVGVRVLRLRVWIKRWRQPSRQLHSSAAHRPPGHKPGFTTRGHQPCNFLRLESGAEWRGDGGRGVRLLSGARRTCSKVSPCKSRTAPGVHTRREHTSGPY
jgi:hypothetical protein